MRKLYVIFLITSLLFAVSVFQLIRKNIQCEEVLSNEISLYEKKVKSYESNLILQLESNGIAVKENVELVFLNDTCSLREIIGHERKLVFRFTSNSCRKCVDKQLSFIKVTLNNIKSNKIIILCTFEQMRDQYLFKETNNLNELFIYNIGKYDLNLPIEKYEIPFFFTIDSTLTTNDLFIPDIDVENEGLINEYFKNILRILI